MNMVTLASFNKLDQAEAVRDRLAQEDIHAHVYDESKVQRFWFMSEPLAAIKLEVPEQEFDIARTVMDRLNASEDLLHNAVRCPQCNSSRVEYPQFTRKFLTPTLVELACTLKVVEKEFYCEDCHYTWPKEAHADPERDVLGWPMPHEHHTEEHVH
jgi:hypothetical protein